MMVVWLNLGPIVVRRRLFLEMGGFNQSYSKKGELGIGFDAELTARVVESGADAALVCPSRATYFRNGCGGKATTATTQRQRQRLGVMARNERLFTEQFQANEPQLLAKLLAAQSALSSNASALLALTRLFPNCSKCSARGDKDSGFHQVDHLCRESSESHTVH